MWRLLNSRRQQDEEAAGRRENAELWVAFELVAFLSSSLFPLHVYSDGKRTRLDRPKPNQTQKIVVGLSHLLVTILSLFLHNRQCASEGFTVTQHPLRKLGLHREKLQQENI